MTRKPTTRNRAAQDATLINIRALKKRLADLEWKFQQLEGLKFLPPSNIHGTLGQWLASRRYGR